MPIATINPATGEVVKTFQPLTEADIEKKLQLAVKIFRSERKLRLPCARSACARPLKSSSAIKISSAT